MIFLTGVLTKDLFFIMIGLLGIFLGIPVFIAFYFTLRHSSFYLKKVIGKASSANLIYISGIVILTMLVLVIIMGCFFLYMYISI